MREQQLSGVRI